MNSIYNIYVQLNKPIWDKIDATLHRVFDQVNTQVTMGIYDQIYEIFDHPVWFIISNSIQDQVANHVKNTHQKEIISE